MKHGLLFVSLVFVVLIGVAQQDMQFTHFKEYALFYNPAYAGVGDGVCGDLIGRNQWAGLNGAPKTVFFDVRYASEKLHGGAGLTVVNDQLGFQKQTYVNASYSYKREIQNVGKLYVGISMAINKASWNGGFIPPQSYNDPNIPFGGYSSSVINSSVGMYYTRDKLFMGLSATNLNEGVFKGSSQFNFNTVRHYYVLAGYGVNINRAFDLIPSVFAKSDGVSTQVDIKTKLIYNNQFFAGINYRISDAISPIAGVYLVSGSTKITFSYSYDVTTSAIRNHSSGSHEIAIGVCRKIVPIPDRHVDPRNLGERGRF